MGTDGTIQTHESTRERLLRAAAELFAERGRDRVSIRDIAAAAGVRHGCINYHFRSKDELYDEALLRFCPPPVGAAFPREAPAELGEEEARELFARIVRGIVREITGKEDPVSTGLLHGEISRPGGPNELLFERVIRPRQRIMAALIGRMFPALTDERERAVAAFNVASQCLFLRMARPVALRLFGAEEFDEELTALVADRIVETSLRGLGSPVGEQP